MSTPTHDLAGKTMLVTGATAGMGLEAAVQLASRGATLILVGRDVQRTADAVAAVKSRSGSTLVSSLLCDFGSIAQTRRLAEEVKQACPRLDVLINNAGSVSATRELSADGYEKTFAVNHLGYFVLTKGLLDLLEKSTPARIVNVASGAHYSGTLVWDDLQFSTGGFSTLKAYARSKLANVLFTLELSRRLQGTGVTVNCLHPGAVATNIWSHAPGWTRPILSLAALFMRTPKQAADVIVHLATSPELANVTGHYFDQLKDTTPSKAALDPQNGQRLWTVSEQLIQGK